MKKIGFYTALALLLVGTFFNFFNANAQTVNQSFLIDLGSTQLTTSTGWNSLSSSNTGAAVTLKNTTGVTTPYVLTVTNGFIGTNPSGTTASSLYPASATRDSFYLSPYAPADTVGQFRLTNLNDSSTYKIKFFASRTATDGTNRTARYTVGTQSVTLSANNNVTNTVEIADIIPTDGAITIDMTLVGSYGYIGVLDITEFGGGELPPTNQAPTVNAGSDQLLITPTDTVDLSGSVMDADGSVVSHGWSQVSGPTASILSPESLVTSATGLGVGTYVFRLTATDDAAAVSYDNVTITISEPAPNQTPYVNAGSNRIITLPTSSTNLSGLATDSDGNVTSLEWTFLSGPVTPVIVTPINAQTSIIGLVDAGTYVFRLTATDDDGASSFDDVQVTVSNPAPNQVPTVNAGSDKTITLPASNTSLTGTATDSDGSIAGYEWAFVSGPATPVIVTPIAAQTSITGLISAGTYTLRLTATDDDGASSFDDVNIIVNPEPPVGPSCSAKKIVAIGSSTTAGTGANPISNSWVNRYRTYLKTLNTSSDVVNQGVGGTTTYAAMPTGSVPPAGRPTPLTASNITAAIAKNPHGIIVNFPSNDVALNYTLEEQQYNIKTIVEAATNAGIPIWITTTQPRNMTDEQRNQQMAMRDWINRIYGPNALDFWSTVANSDGTINSTYNSGDGVHVNNAGHGIFFDRVVASKVYESLCDNTFNLLPYADAGLDKNVMPPLDSVTLTGSGTDLDGSVNGYLWSLVSGPNTPLISSDNGGQGIITGLVPGTYTFRLSVTDNEGALGYEDVYVTVLGSMSNIPNLVSRYTFDSQDLVWTSTTSEVKDITGGISGDAFSLSSSNQNPSGKIGGALNFSTNRYISLGQTHAVNPTDEYSISFWAKLPSVGTTGTFISKAFSSSNRSLQIMNVSNTLQVAVGGTNITTNKSLVANQWNHIALTHRGNTNTIYLNGVAVKTATSGTQVSANTDLLIGARRNGSNTSIGYTMAAGSIDDVRIYNRYLTPTEILIISSVAD